MYKCEFPNCDYECSDRNQIHEHHIVPKELNGSNKRFNIIRVCPNCHARIYIPESKHGNHSIKSKNSVVLLQWLKSTDGKVLSYIENDEVKYY